MNYRCLKDQIYTIFDYALIPLRYEDLRLIQKWRNEQLDILRQEKILTNADQELYWKTVLQPSFSEERPKQILFSFLMREKVIGYGGLTHIDWSALKAEVSFLLETKRSKDIKCYESDFLIFLKLLDRVAFHDLCFQRLFTETFDLRPFHVKVLENFGFKLEGRLKKHVKVGDKYHDSLIHGFVKDANISKN